MHYQGNSFETQKLAVAVKYGQFIPPLQLQRVVQRTGVKTEDATKDGYPGLVAGKRVVIAFFSAIKRAHNGGGCQGSRAFLCLEGTRHCDCVC